MRTYLICHVIFPTQFGIRVCDNVTMEIGCWFAECQLVSYQFNFISNVNGGEKQAFSCDPKYSDQRSTCHLSRNVLEAHRVLLAYFSSEEYCWIDLRQTVVASSHNDRTKYQTSSINYSLQLGAYAKCQNVEARLNFVGYTVIGS